MEKMQKNLIKFGLGIVGIAALGAAVFYGVQWYQYRNSPEYAQKLEYQKLVEAYKNDTYGGDTPEETLQLFIDALKAGDTELAAKYFVLDEREKMREDLLALSEIQIQNIISDISVAKRDDTNAENGKVVFKYNKKVQSGFIEVDGKKIDIPSGDYLQTIILTKNINNKWKILEL